MKKRVCERWEKDEKYDVRNIVQIQADMKILWNLVPHRRYAFGCVRTRGNFPSFFHLLCGILEEINRHTIVKISF
jgi:hypothetical protein